MKEGRKKILARKGQEAGMRRDPGKKYFEE
jgi:hypothetical protein